MVSPNPFSGGYNTFVYQMKKGEASFDVHQNNSPTYNGGYSTGGSGSYGTNMGGSNRNTQTRNTCPLCHGQKRIVKDTHPALYGTTDYQVKCNECGGYFMRSTGHTHVTCPQCHGKGYFTTN